tara:strand:+ start:783 stop:1400 length:618 start_codon:yes stop_codon:yes gene_type:complete
MRNIRKKYLISDYEFIYLRHELLQNGFSLTHAIITEFMFKYSKFGNTFPFPISCITTATGISNDTIYKCIDKLKKCGHIRKNESSLYEFSEAFIEEHENMCSRVKRENFSYSIIPFHYVGKLGLNFQEYALLDSFRNLTKKSPLRYHPKYFAKIFNFDESYYYILRKRLHEKKCIKIHYLNFLELTPKAKQKMEDFLKNCPNIQL